jgi:hypothetical protein
MPVESQIHVGDIGTIIELTVLDQDEIVFPLNTATTLEIIIKSPGGVTTTKTATLSTDGLDGKMRCSLSSTDIDSAGNWKFQARVTTPLGTWRTNQFSKAVQGNLI